MIQELCLGGWKVQYLQRKAECLDVFSCFVDGVFLGECLRQDKKGEVWRIFHDTQTFIVKVNRPFDKLLERRVKSLFKGSCYSRLISRVERARKHGCFSPCEIYLVAEKSTFRFAECSIVIMEDIDGVLLGSSVALIEQYKLSVKDILVHMHKTGLSSGDVHSGNFILSADGTLRIIDLAGRGAGRLNRAKDWLGLWHRFGVNPPEYNIVMWWVFSRHHRRFVKKKS